MTLRILGINAAAFLILVLGILYLSQYKEKLIESAINNFETEVFLISMNLSDGNIDSDIYTLSANKTEDIIGRLAGTLQRRIMVFNQNHVLIADSQRIIHHKTIETITRESHSESEPTFFSNFLENIGKQLTSIMNKKVELETFSGTSSKNGRDYPNVMEALNNKLSISIWKNGDDDFILTAAMPIYKKDQIIGSVLVISDSRDIKSALSEASLNIMKIFFVTLIITIVISLYLSHVIARPLRKLSRAARDVQKEKRRHIEIPDMHDRFDEIGDLSVVLRNMTQALWDRMDTIESFASDVSHEIKNPLTSLKSAVETAMIVKKKEDQDKLLHIIKHDIERMDRLITDISKASRLDAELSREQFYKINLYEFLRELVDLYHVPLERLQKNSGDHINPSFSDRNISIQLRALADKDIFVFGNANRLNQVLQNLISNAMSFSPEGGKIIITTIERDKSEHVLIQVEDHGPGIPESNLEKIFDRFYSDRPVHEAYGNHSGLGLSICKQIIDSHKGEIYAENVKDTQGRITGARFSIILTIV